ncbi:hypothetical protein OG2516_00974 [Oceanicola granulosus HTCC2516]|uniref:Glycosyl transferase, group 2 family protein n=1 Tax=Oceanicola granulosus (strain ATCC BAA-861 / DSM 15982 / KCTC 12143 / HTCC2516) TaxID=314256 RepID=Q2CJ45_OCEGH|nr:glycosyltransferase family 2 protein [Oceanicola granulosus]EAR52755.1 hypothetical protein OG2516_00974 [Oceanicola granulosus HTCC2516]
MRITSITPMKDEAPYILEWVAYHRLIGVNDIIVFSNDCTDGTDQMLERLDEMGLLRHYPNPSMITGAERRHTHALRYLNSGARLRRSDWVASLDVDEYICVNAGAGRLEDLFAAAEGANVIYMNQHNFGSGGAERFDDVLTTDRFRHAWAKDAAYHRKVNRRGVKTITHRSAEPTAWHNHSPIFDGDRLDLVHAVNGSGKPIDKTAIDISKDVKSLTALDYGFDLVQLNHYALRSLEDYLLKVARGNANHNDFGDELHYWRRYEHNDLLDENITRWLPDLADAHAELLKDAELRQLHEGAVARARARAAELRAAPGMRKLVNRLLRFQARNPVEAAPA